MPAPSGFQVLADAAPQAAYQQQQIKEQQRVQQQNTVGAQLLDSINNASNIKPTVKDPDTGQDIPNPAYAQAQTDKQKLLSQYVTLNSPAQHASFAQHLHGLIFGTPSDGHQQPALSPNSSPVASTVQPDATAAPAPAPAQPSAPAHPMAPLPADHPANKITEGLAALKNHLAAAAHPIPAPTPPDTALMSQYHVDPAQVQFERNKELWGERGQNALAVAQERTKALMASLQARPPRLLSQTTVPDLLDQMKVDPTMVIYGPSGQELSAGQLAELPPGTVAREFRAGSQIFYALGDQNSKTANIGGQIYQIPAIGEISPNNVTALGQATSTLPKQHASASTDVFGNTTRSASTSQTATTPGITAPAPPVSSAAPTLLRRPDGLASPVSTPLSAINNQISAANSTSPKLNKGKPVSSNAPLAPLDADGHIPAGTGNELVRQYANNLLDGQDSKNIPNPGARAAAEQMASRYGWSQGAFTPREKVQFQTATTFLKQLQDSKSLSVLDSLPSRIQIAKAIDPKGGVSSQGAASTLDDQQREFIRLYNAAVGTVQGLSSITRSGRSTESSVARLKAELPNVLQSSSSDDAKKRIDQLLLEANTALSTNPANVGKKGPVSANAPKNPGSAPQRPPGVPSDAVWNQQANNGKGQWEK